MEENNLDSKNWLISEQDFRLEEAQIYETLFALGNGYLGMRGTLEEGLGGAGMEGTYINGFYESAPIIYGEKFYGFAENKQTMLNLANAKVITLTIGDEAFNLLTGKIMAYRRELDMRQGILRRSVHWQSPQGKQIQLDVERMVLQEHPHTALIGWQLTPLNFDGAIQVFSGIDGAIRQSEHAEGDPRLGTQFEGEVLQLVEQGFVEEAAIMAHRTKSTQYLTACGIMNVVQAEHTCEKVLDTLTAGFRYILEAQRGVPIRLEKYIAYASSRDTEETQVTAAVLKELRQAAAAGYDALRTEQVGSMQQFWENADITIQGEDSLQRGIRFNMFHLLQSAGRDGHTNIAAKGLTGLGYEGHYFWDTEVYILPFFLFTKPEISRKLLEYRYHILDKAREHARKMGHTNGALYAWRTINGEECSANYPTGSAQYHINADIAFAIRRYYDATQDADFMAQYGAEILCETARLWHDTGDYIPSKNNQFCINAVTGPDEYQILVNNNAYTNLMARENLRFASENITWLQRTNPEAYKRLAAKIKLQDHEAMDWQKAAEAMYIPYDEQRGIIPQDDAFLGKAVWDFEHTPAERHPLLLHHHPLLVTRYQVCKQADLVLAEYLLRDQFERAQKQRDYAYYEPITTHDSSLSGCIFGMVAAELGDTEKAYRYFAETAITDLENWHGNTQSGIHAANMAGAWQSIVFGFAGMRAKNGLAFNPVIPSQWEAYAFKVCYRGRLVGVQVSATGADFRLLSGEPLEIQVWGEARLLDSAKQSRIAPS